MMEAEQELAQLLREIGLKARSIRVMSTELPADRAERIETAVEKAALRIVGAAYVAMGAVTDGQRVEGKAYRLPYGEVVVCLPCWKMTEGGRLPVPRQRERERARCWLCGAHAYVKRG